MQTKPGNSGGGKFSWHGGGGLATVPGVRSLYGLLVSGMLIACLLAAWAHRFAPVDGASAVGLESLVLHGAEPAGFMRDGGALRMEAGKDAAPGASFAIPGTDGARHLYVRFHAAARDLVRGPESWDDGRLFFEWMDDGGGVIGVSRVHSARGDDGSGLQELVVSSPARGAVPVLCFQNLGESGSYMVDRLVIVPARERAVWRVGRWFLAAGFLAVLATWLAGTKKPAHWRGWVAAGLWMIVAACYAFPGPWEVALPFGVPFVFGEVPAMETGETGETNADRTIARAATDGDPMLEQLPPSDDPGLRLRQMLPWLRPLMHVTLLFFPVLAIAWLVGARGALCLGLALSVSIETSQVMFGFGFGWDDVGDLFFNSLGIAAALWAHRRFARRIHALLPFPFPEPAAPSIADGPDEQGQPARSVE